MLGGLKAEEGTDREHDGVARARQARGRCGAGDTARAPGWEAAGARDRLGVEVRRQGVPEAGAGGLGGCQVLGGHDGMGLGRWHI